MVNLKELLIFPLRLEEAQLPYMITGALAATFYGDPRLTRDIDLVLHLPLQQLSHLTEVFPPENFYCPPLEVMRIEASRTVGGHFNIIDSSTALKADIYPLAPAMHARNAFKRRRRMPIEGHEFWVAPPEYVIAYKLEYYRQGGSDKHLQDIKGMLNNSSCVINNDELTDYLSALRLTDLWSQLVGSDVFNPPEKQP